MTLRFYIALFLLLAVPLRGESAASGRIIKVLHHFVDAEGRHALAPSLFERDAYQVYLRDHPEQVSGARFDIQYKARRKDGPVRLRIEVRGSKTGLGKSERFETDTLPSRWGSSWARIELDKSRSDAVGSILAWRATLWRDGFLIGEQQSFLW
jgi:hypothetical protein